MQLNEVLVPALLFNICSSVCILAGGEAATHSRGPVQTAVGSAGCSYNVILIPQLQQPGITLSAPFKV